MNIELSTLSIERQPWFSAAAVEALDAFEKSKGQAVQLAGQASEARAAVSLSESGKEALKRAQAARVAEYDAALSTVACCESAEALVVRVNEAVAETSAVDQAERLRLREEHEARLAEQLSTKHVGHRDIRILARENPSKDMEAARIKRAERLNFSTGALAPFREALAQCQQASRSHLEQVALGM